MLKRDKPDRHCIAEDQMGTTKITLIQDLFIFPARWRLVGLLVAVLLPSLEPAHADQVQGSESAPAISQSAEKADQIIEKTAAPGTVLKGMTMDKVLAARGVPIRKEAIPPDAELWYYHEGDVAFAGGKVSYVGIKELRAPGTTAQQKQLDELLRKTVEPQVPETSQTADTARVHTPGDGFLALRSDPTIRRGKRLLKIPHGACLTLDECIAHSADGRWCRTTFEGKTGWVFDRYLIR
jgi:hypothetical protein